jgi:3-hydroxyisobutyrate dehydrogenase-like beta-hydroxyacid dehydrogenase
LRNNGVAATNAAVLGEALLVAARAGVDLDALTTVLGAGSGGSAMRPEGHPDATARLHGPVQARALGSREEIGA